jgi:hypothetical protein
MTDASQRLVQGVVRLDDQEALRQLVARPLDFGCRPTVVHDPEGGFSVPVIATREAFAALRADGFAVTPIEPATTDFRAEVGEGDRFAGGRIAPKGFGRKVADEVAGDGVA